MSKNDSKWMMIGEVAKAVGITRRIILNYEEKGLVQPDKKEGETGNRYYSIDSLTRIRTIRVLQNLGLSLDDIFAYYNGTSDLTQFITRLEDLRDEINFNIERLKERVKSENDFEIQTVTIPAQTVYCQTLYSASVDERKELLREIALAAIRQYGSDISKHMFSIRYSMEEPDLISYCIAVPADSRGEYIIQLPEEKALCIFYHGSYESISFARDKICSFAEENGIALTGICQHIYLEGPPHHKEPEKFITQVAVLTQGQVVQ